MIKKERAEYTSDEQIVKQLRPIALQKEIIDAFVMIDSKKIQQYIKTHRKKGYSDAQIQDALEHKFNKKVIDVIFDKLGRK